MLIEQQIKHYRALNEWFQSALGLSVAREFTTALEPVKEYLRGETVLQLGNCGDNLWLNSLSFNHQWVASPCVLNNKTTLECSLSHIPLARNSIDCIIAPLTLEPFGANLNLIDEIDRILKPMGFVVILSLNPWSLWGGAIKCGLLHCFGSSKIKMRAPFSLNRTFLQRGYRQCSLSNFCYIPPVTNELLIKKFTFFEEIGKMLWPFPSGFYCYIAQKYEYMTPTPIVSPVAHPSVSKKYKSPLQPATN